jgi:hypothetical protein
MQGLLDYATMDMTEIEYSRQCVCLWASLFSFLKQNLRNRILLLETKSQKLEAFDSTRLS